MTDRQPTGNRLLAALPRETLARLIPDLKYTQLACNDVLFEAGSPTRSAYFLNGGLVTLLSGTESGSVIEVGMVGHDGVVGIQSGLGVSHSLHRVVVQIPSDALMIKTDAFRTALERESVLRDLLLRYCSALLVQISQSVVCNHFHTVEQRLCRRLLATRDYTGRDTFCLTQERLSQMLGARRTGVTRAATELQQAGLIRYRWGRITLIDRRGLEAGACECYRRIMQLRQEIGIAR